MTSENLFLENTEIERLTGKFRRPAQRRVLCLMGIEHRVRPDGALIVSRSHVEKILDGVAAQRQERRVEPNWNAIR